VTLPDAGAEPAPAVRGGLLGPGVLVAAGMAVGQVLGYALSVLGARLLGPETFSELGTLLGLLVIGAVVPLGMQTVAARRVAAGDEGAEPAQLLRLSLLAGTAVSVVALLLVPVAVTTLDLEPVPTALVAVTLLPLTVAGAALGLTQGREHFPRLAWQYAVLAVARVGLSVAVLVATRSVTATMVAEVVGAVAGWLAIHRGAGLPWSLGRPVPRAAASEMGHITHALLAMFVFTNADLLLARATLSPAQAGTYAAGAIVLKIAFWLPQAVAVVVFPRLVGGGTRALALGMGVVIGLGLLVTVGVAVLGPWLLPVLLGPAYAGLTADAALFALAGTAEAVAYLLLFSRLAAEDRWAAAAVWGAVVALAALVLTVAHTSPRSIVLAVLGVSVALCLVGAWAHRHDDASALTASRA
jgi:O-antigen/teichoic acid export membrane protein